MQLWNHLYIYYRKMKVLGAPVIRTDWWNQRIIMKKYVGNITNHGGMEGFSEYWSDVNHYAVALTAHSWQPKKEYLLYGWSSSRDQEYQCQETLELFTWFVEAKCLLTAQTNSGIFAGLFWFLWACSQSDSNQTTWVKNAWKAWVLVLIGL